MDSFPLSPQLRGKLEKIFSVTIHKHSKLATKDRAENYAKKMNEWMIEQWIYQHGYRTEEEDVNIYFIHLHVQCERPFVVRALYANIH